MGLDRDARLSIYAQARNPIGEYVRHEGHMPQLWEIGAMAARVGTTMEDLGERR